MSCQALTVTLPVRSAPALHDWPPPRWSPFWQRYFLFCHALELLLKAQVLATGGDQEELFAIRHDLEKAYGRAVELGYSPGDDRAKQLVIWLAPYHKDHTFRYKETGYLIVPTADNLIATLNSMYREIEQTVRAAYLTQQSKSEPPP
jgi:hypothetical protein